MVTLVFDAKVQQKLHIRKFFSEIFAYVRQGANVATGEFLFKGWEREGKTKRQMSEVLLFFDMCKYARIFILFLRRKGIGEEHGVLQSKCLLLGYVMGSTMTNEYPTNIQRITKE